MTDAILDQTLDYLLLDEEESGDILKRVKTNSITIESSQHSK